MVHKGRRGRRPGAVAADGDFGGGADGRRTRRGGRRVRKARARDRRETSSRDGVREWRGPREGRRGDIGADREDEDAPEGVGLGVRRFRRGGGPRRDRGPRRVLASLGRAPDVHLPGRPPGRALARVASRVGRGARSRLRGVGAGEARAALGASARARADARRGLAHERVRRALPRGPHPSRPAEDRHGEDPRRVVQAPERPRRIPHGHGQIPRPALFRPGVARREAEGGGRRERKHPSTQRAREGAIRERVRAPSAIETRARTRGETECVGLETENRGGPLGARRREGARARARPPGGARSARVYTRDDHRRRGGG